MQICIRKLDFVIKKPNLVQILKVILKSIISALEQISRFISFVAILVVNKVKITLFTELILR